MNKEQFLSELSRLFIANISKGDENSKLSNMIIERLVLRELTDEFSSDHQTLEELNEFKEIRNFGLKSFFYKLGNGHKVFPSEFKSYEELLSALMSKSEELIRVSYGENIGISGTTEPVISQKEAQVLYENLLLPYYKSLGFKVSKNNDGAEVVQLPILADELYGDNNPSKVAQLKSEYVASGSSSEDFDFVYSNCGVEREACSMPFAPSELGLISARLKSVQLENTQGQKR